MHKHGYFHRDMKPENLLCMVSSFYAQSVSRHWYSFLCLNLQHISSGPRSCKDCGLWSGSRNPFSSSLHRLCLHPLVSSAWGSTQKVALSISIFPFSIEWWPLTRSYLPWKAISAQTSAPFSTFLPIAEWKLDFQYYWWPKNCFGGVCGNGNGKMRSKNLF